MLMSLTVALVMTFWEPHGLGPDRDSGPDPDPDHEHDPNIIMEHRNVSANVSAIPLLTPTLTLTPTWTMT